MNILVTGGAGYLGSVLVPALLEKGYRVTVIDSFLYRQTSLLDCCFRPGLEIVRGDARDPQIMEPLLEAADVVIPLACIVGAPACDQNPVEARSINHEAVTWLLGARTSHQRIIFPTTNSGYGSRQEGTSHCTEETPLRPVSLYARLKAHTEEELLEAGGCTTLRLATLFGTSPRMRLDLLVNDFVHRAVSDRVIVLFESHFTRNYLHVRDAARAFLHCIESPDSVKDEAYNVGLSDANLSKRELCEEIAQEVPRLEILESDTGRDPDRRNYVVSNEKFESTGFRPRFSLRDGIRELVKGYEILRPQFANR